MWWSRLALGRQLHVLYDGATLSARMDRDPTAASVAREAAAVLLDAAPMAPGAPLNTGAADVAAAVNVANRSVEVDARDSGRV